MSPVAQRVVDHLPGRDRGRSRAHLRLVRASDVRRFRPGMLGSLAVGMVLVILFSLAAVQGLLVQRQLEIDDLSRNVVEQEALRNKLLTDVALLENPTRVIASAEKLGLVTPDAVVYLDPGRLPEADTLPSNVPVAPVQVAQEP